MTNNIPSCGFSLEMAVYKKVGNPKKLKHKPMNLLEWFVSKLMSSHVCQICGRKEIWSVSGWLQINDPVYKDKDNCSVICFECADLNKEVFEINRMGV